MLKRRFPRSGPCLVNPHEFPGEFERGRHTLLCSDQYSHTQVQGQPKLPTLVNETVEADGNYATALSATCPGTFHRAADSH